MNIYILSQVKFARPETEKAKAQRLSSFKYLEQKKAEEPWTNVQFFSLQVKVTACLLCCCDKICPNHCFYVMMIIIIILISTIIVIIIIIIIIIIVIFIIIINFVNHVVCYRNRAQCRKNKTASSLESLCI